MKKVIFFIDNLCSGGAQRQVVNVAALLKKAGYDTEVLVYQDIPFYKPLLDKNQIPVTLVESGSYLKRIIDIRRYLCRSDADCVIAFLETPCFIACVSKIGHKKWRLITTERSAKISTFTTRRNKFFNRFERFANAKIGNSENAMNMWRKYYPQYSNKYSVIYNHVIVPDEFVSQKHEYLSDGKLHLSVAASYQGLKNPLRVIEAVNALSDENKKKLIINWYGRIEIEAGNTLAYDKAAQKIKEYQLECCIHLHDQSDEIYKIMAESDAVGLFSTVEGLPNTICEAMTIGKPVIMSKVSDYSVLVSDNGFLCDPKSVDSIKEALEKLLCSSAEELEKMGRLSKEKAHNLFSAEVITEQWINAINAK